MWVCCVPTCADSFVSLSICVTFILFTAPQLQRLLDPTKFVLSIVPLNANIAPQMWILFLRNSRWGKMATCDSYFSHLNFRIETNGCITVGQKHWLLLRAAVKIGLFNQDLIKRKQTIQGTDPKIFFFKDICIFASYFKCSSNWQLQLFHRSSSWER